MNFGGHFTGVNLRQNSSFQMKNSDRSGNTTTLGCIGRNKTLLLKNCVLLHPDPSQHVWRWVRAISDPLEHLLINQVEIRHQPSYTAN